MSDVDEMDESKSSKVKNNNKRKALANDDNNTTPDHEEEEEEEEEEEDEDEVRDKFKIFCEEILNVVVFHSRRMKKRSVLFFIVDERFSFVCRKKRKVLARRQRKSTIISRSARKRKFPVEISSSMKPVSNWAKNFLAGCDFLISPADVDDEEEEEEEEDAPEEGFVEPTDHSDTTTADFYRAGRSALTLNDESVDFLALVFS
jgi:hypothetical protein